MRLSSILVLAYVTTLFLIGIENTSMAQVPDTLWTKTYGTVTIDYAEECHQTSDGGYFIAGNTYISGLADIYLIKTDSVGDTMWTAIYGTVGVDRYDLCYSGQQTSDGGYILIGGTTTYSGPDFEDIYIVKTDQNGDTAWTRIYGSTGEERGNSVKQTPDGGYIIAGFTTSFGAGSEDAYILRLDSNGDTVWTKTYGGIASERGYSIQMTFDGSFILGGYTSSFGPGGVDFYLVKMDANGDSIWAKAYGTSQTECCISMQQTSDSGFVMCGWSGSAVGPEKFNFYMLKTDQNGDSLWARSYGEYGYHDEAYSIIETLDRGYLMVGSTASYGADLTDVYLVRTDSNGDSLWASTYGGSGFDYARSVSMTSDGGYIIAGRTTSFGLGEYDVYLIKIAFDTTSACSMNKTDGTTGYTVQTFVQDDGALTYFDPAVECTGLPTYPFEIISLDLTLDDFAGAVWPVDVDLVAYALSDPSDPCQGPGAELCRETFSCDEASFSDPDIGTLTFTNPCCIDGPVFIGIQYTGSTNTPYPSIFFDTQTSVACDNWGIFAGLGYYNWTEWYTLWGSVVPGYPVFWVNGETHSPACIQPIPTLSEWSMLIMALLLLAAGTVAIVRRRRATVKV